MGQRLRKAIISVTTKQNNAGSFVNVTAKNLHVRKLKLSIKPVSTQVAGDSALISIDEVPVLQFEVNDSRAHIAAAWFQNYEVVDAAPTTSSPKDTITFNRDQLVLEPDEALFVNTQDLGGDPTMQASVNIFYED